MIVFFVLYLVSNNFLYQLYAAQSVCRLSGELSNEVLAVVAPELNNNRLCAYVATGSYLSYHLCRAEVAFCFHLHLIIETPISIVILSPKTAMAAGKSSLKHHLSTSKHYKLRPILYWFIALVVVTSKSFISTSCTVAAFQARVTQPQYRHHSLLSNRHHPSRKITNYLQIVSAVNMNQDSSFGGNTDNIQPAKRMRPSPPSPDGEGVVDAPSAAAAAVVQTPNPQKKGTLYITIGPQCAGKTTMLKEIFGKSFHKNEESAEDDKTPLQEAGGVDITIDDQTLVYIPLPTDYFLGTSTSIMSNDTTASYPSLNQSVHGKTLHERIHDPSNQELIAVLKRLAGTLSAEEVAMQLKQDKGSDSVQDDLISAVEHVIQTQKGETTKNDDTSATLPESIDLFIVESIFRPRPTHLMQQIQTTFDQGNNASEANSALDQALSLIKTHATNPQIHAATSPLSWGNTNTRPREFTSALEAAVLSGRPVEFIVFGGMEVCGMIRQHLSRTEYNKINHDGNEDAAAANGDSDDQSEEKSLLCLPKVDRKTLLIRNIQRFIQTGRYVPSNAIADAMVRVESLLASAAAEANKEYPKDANHDDNDSASKTKISMGQAKFRLDYELAKLAGYKLDVDRTVSLIPGANNNSNHRRDNRNESGGRYGRGRNSYQSGGGRGDYGGSRNSHGRYDNGRGRGSGSGRGRHYDGGRGYQGRGRYNDGRGSGRGGRGYDDRDGYGSGGRGGRSSNWNRDSRHPGSQWQEHERWQSDRREYDGRGRGQHYSGGRGLDDNHQSGGRNEYRGRGRGSGRRYDNY